MSRVDKQLQSPMTVTPGTYGIVALVLLIFFGAEQIATLFLVELYPKLRDWNAATTKQWLNSFSIEFCLILLCYPTVLLVVWLWFLRGRRQVQQAIGLLRPKFKNILWVMIGLVLFYIGSALILSLLSQLSPALKANSQLNQQLNITAIHGPVEIIAAVFGLAVLDPITEELVFRGVIFTSLKQKLPVVPAALICSVIFTVPHMLENSSSILYALGISIFCLSLILCFVRQKTGNIYAGMVIHSFVNATSIIALLKSH